MSRKPRSDSVLASLTPQQKATLRTWLVDDNKPYEEVRELLYQDFNIRTSTGALSKFYATECFSLRSSEAKEFADQCVRELTDSGEKFDEATIALVKQKAFERAYARNGNLKELATLAKIIGDSLKLKLKEKDQQLAERRVALLEKKAEQADKAKAITADKDLSDEEKAAKMRQLFGIS